MFLWIQITHCTPTLFAWYSLEFNGPVVLRGMWTNFFWQTYELCKHYQCGLGSAYFVVWRNLRCLTGTFLYRLSLTLNLKEKKSISKHEIKQILCQKLCSLSTIFKPLVTDRRFGSITYKKVSISRFCTIVTILLTSYVQVDICNILN